MGRAHGELHGLYRKLALIPISGQRIEHLKPHTTSRSMFKGIVAERAGVDFQ